MGYIVYTSVDAPGFDRLYSFYRTFFPNSDEAEDMDGIRADFALVGDPAIAERWGEYGEWWVAAEEEGELVGGVNFVSFRACGTAHVNYIFTSPACRNRGIASALLRKVREMTGAEWIFCEQDDPEKMSADALAADLRAAGISCGDRIRWWSRRGFGRLDMTYVQPPLAEGKDPSLGMTLNVFPSDSPVPGGVVAGHLERFYYVCVLKKREGRDSLADALVAEAASRDYINVSRYL